MAERCTETCSNTARTKILAIGMGLSALMLTGCGVKVNANQATLAECGNGLNSGGGKAIASASELLSHSSSEITVLYGRAKKTNGKIEVPDQSNLFEITANKTSLKIELYNTQLLDGSKLDLLVSDTFEFKDGKIIPISAASVSCTSGNTLYPNEIVTYLDYLSNATSSLDR